MNMEYQGEVPAFPGEGLAPAVQPPEALPVIEGPPVSPEVSPEGLVGRTRAVLARHKGKLALAACGASLALPFVTHPVDQAAEKVGSAVAWTVAGGAVSETMFCVGIGMMGAAVGAKLGKNPIKWKDRLPEVCEKADNSRLFKSGFWINTAGAVGTAAIGGYAAAAHLPVESIPGAMTLPAVDFYLTYAIRKMMLDGIKANKDKVVAQA